MEHHEHEIPEDAPSTQQQQQQEGRKYHHNKDASEQKQEQKQKQAQEHNQERREEMIVNTRPREKEGDDTVTMAVFVSSDDEEGEGPCGGGTPVAKEGGKSMPIHADRAAARQAGERHVASNDRKRQPRGRKGAATKASLSSPPPRPCSSTSPMPSADTTDYFDRSGTNGTKTQDPVIRFEMVERLGYGSGGSSVYKARDKLEGLKMVAIKKIPLSTLAGVSGDHKSSGTTTATATQSDVDYYMACIADYTKDNGYHNINMNMNLNTDNANGHDNKDNNNNNNNNTSMMNGVHLGSRDSSTAFWDREGGSRHAQTEIRISTKIGKPTRHRDRIVQCLGCHPTENELWLSLEFCGGGSVEDLIRLSDGPLTESEIGWIMSQVLLGVEFLHSKDHVHGDIKASNILLMVDGHVKLGGSGSVLDHKTGAGERRRRRRALTMAELPLSWLAPEATPILSNPPGARVPRDSASIPFASAETDIWALGIACIELFQGRPPKPDTPILKWLEEPRFAGQTAAGNYMGGFSTPLGMTGNVTGGSIGGWGSIQTGVRDFRTEMSEEMWSFVGRCLTPDPMARPRVRDLLEAKCRASGTDPTYDGVCGSVRIHLIRQAIQRQHVNIVAFLVFIRIDVITDQSDIYGFEATGGEHRAMADPYGSTSRGFGLRRVYLL
ncbi:hypothetical protein BGX31_000851 [Mortierella sp. GBA43]|nr:hypothetical protein BGX31_000851 [Mortierella sp. GBA43]